MLDFNHRPERKGQLGRYEHRWENKKQAVRIQTRFKRFRIGSRGVAGCKQSNEPLSSIKCV
jgi:hypothetical protein